MKLSPKAFWHEYTFADYCIMANRYHENKISDYKDNWNRTRVVTYTLACGNGYKGKMTDYMPFDWDKDDKEFKEIKPLTQDEVNNIIKNL